MGTAQRLLSRRRRHLTVSSLLLLVSVCSHFLLPFPAEGRNLPQSDASSRSDEVEKTMWRARIGSSPPRCEGLCGSCRHCEAVQVPTINPQIRAGIENSNSSDDATNYKPLSWKCKCGNLIFNP